MVHYYCQKRRWLLSQFQQHALSTITTMRSIYRRFATTARKAAYPFRLSLLGVPEQVKLTHTLTHSHTHTLTHMLSCRSTSLFNCVKNKGYFPSLELKWITLLCRRELVQCWRSCTTMVSNMTLAVNSIATLHWFGCEIQLQRLIWLSLSRMDLLLAKLQDSMCS